MPRPGNIVTRSQRAGSTSNTGARTRSRSQNKNNIQESEKENAGRQGSRATRSYPRTGARTGLLGASTNITAVGATTANMVKVKGNDAFEVKTASKGKRVPPPAAVKPKKLPLQDITAEFLPAPEVANREEDAQALVEDIIDDGTESQTNANVVAAYMPPSVFVPLASRFTSPLPPSSPPSESGFTVSPSLNLMPRAEKHFDNFCFSPALPILHEPYDPWQEFDADACHAAIQDSDDSGKVSSNTDPFGFMSLERKLKAEREAPAILASDQDQDGEDADALLLVADTSSPRPVRRRKRSLQYEAELPESAEEEHDHLHLHRLCITPSTPHKKNQKRRRMSYEGHDVFSSFSSSSSVETSPFPSKRFSSAHK